MVAVSLSKALPHLFSVHYATEKLERYMEMLGKSKAKLCVVSHARPKMQSAVQKVVCLLVLLLLAGLNLHHWIWCEKCAAHLYNWC